MSVKIFNLLAVSTLAIMASSFGPAPTNALSTGHNLLIRDAHHGALAKKRRDTKSGRRCKPRPTSSKPPAPAYTPPKNNGGNSGNGGNNGGNGGGNGGSYGGPPATGGSKVGLAWPNGNDPSLANFKTSKVTQLYTWSPFLPDNCKKLGFNCIPMLWGDNQVADFKRLVVPGYANTVLGFNEPNQSGQSDMSPQHGADLWMKYIQPLKQHGYKLISPATTSAPSGKQWMKDFFAACKGCTFDAVALHYYDVNPQDMIDYITDFHNTFGHPIWVTEFACQNFNGGAQKSQGEVDAFANKVTAFMDNSPFVEAYFPFGAMHNMQGVNTANQLMQSNGQPTNLGNNYIH